MDVEFVRQLRHTATFVAGFRTALERTYGWRRRGEAVEVRDWRGRRTISHLPHLASTDLTMEEGRELARSLEGRPYLLRLLDGERAPVSVGEPVTMRLPLEGLDVTGLEGRFREDRMTRANLNRARRDCLEIRSGTEDVLIKEFMRGLSRSLHRLGAPVVPARIVEELLSHLDGELLIVRSEEDAVAGMLLLHDDRFSWTPWLFTRLGRSVRGAGEILFFEAARRVLEKGGMLLDLGRSPFGTSAFEFKLRFGAIPVAITLLRSGVTDPYRFSGAPQAVWRLLPGVLADAAGPALCRHLPEY